MDPLALKRMLRQRMAPVDEGMPPSPPPPGMGMPPGIPGGAPQMSQSQFARPFSPEERMRQARLQAEMLRRTGRQ